MLTSMMRPLGNPPPSAMSSVRAPVDIRSLQSISSLVSATLFISLLQIIFELKNADRLKGGLFDWQKTHISIVSLLLIFMILCFPNFMFRSAKVFSRDWACRYRTLKGRVSCKGYQDMPFLEYEIAGCGYREDCYSRTDRVMTGKNCL